MNPAVAYARKDNFVGNINVGDKGEGRALIPIPTEFLDRSRGQWEVNVCTVNGNQAADSALPYEESRLKSNATCDVEFTSQFVRADDVKPCHAVGRVYL
jgi:hypothetical protein